MNREALIELRARVEAGEWDDWCEMVMEPHPYWARAAFNGSLDAAKSLHEALLPGWSWLLRAPSDIDPFINHCNAGDYLANIWGEGLDPNEGDDHYSAWASSPARAWLLAILLALIAMEEKNDE